MCLCVSITCGYRNSWCQEEGVASFDQELQEIMSFLAWVTLNCGSISPAPRNGILNPISCFIAMWVYDSSPQNSLSKFSATLKWRTFCLKFKNRDIKMEMKCTRSQSRVKHLQSQLLGSLGQEGHVSPGAGEKPEQHGDICLKENNKVDYNFINFLLKVLVWNHLWESYQW